MKEKIKYDNHEEAWSEVLFDEERGKIGRTWLEQKSTLDRWRHDRMYNLLKPVIDFNNALSWLTVGDGRYGTDASALLKLGATNVMCTDISDRLLKIGNETGFITDFSAQNAEDITFDNNQFDFTLCKESYHHFPRPHIALHEMLRVSKLGVILIEPLDSKIEPKILNRILQLIKRISGKLNNNYEHEFEPIGNYIFSISERELEKVQLGMHRRYIAYTYVNDYYERGYEFISLETSDKTEIKKIKKAKLIIRIRDLLVKYNLISAGLLCAILFKEEPSSSLVKLLRNSGWHLKKLPRNQYL